MTRPLRVLFGATGEQGHFECLLLRRDDLPVDGYQSHLDGVGADVDGQDVVCHAYNLEEQDRDVAGVTVMDGRRREALPPFQVSYRVAGVSHLLPLGCRASFPRARRAPAAVRVPRAARVPRARTCPGGKPGGQRQPQQAHHREDTE